MSKLPQRWRQAGFTIIELMVALTISLLLMVVLFGLWLDAIRNAAWVTTQVNLNEQAREMFDILAYGRRYQDMNVISPTSPYTVNSATGSADYHYVFGLRGRRTTTGSTLGFDTPCLGTTGDTDCLMAKSDDATPVPLYRLILPSNGATTADQGLPVGALISDSVSSITLACKTAGEPVIECTNDSGSATLTGFLRGAPALVDSGIGTLREITLPLIDPWATNNPEFSLYNISDTYWTVFNLHVQRIP